MSILEEFAKAALKKLSAESLLRKPPYLETSQDALVRVEGKTLINLCSNNYLGFANDPKLVYASQKGASSFGLGAGASRLVSGTLECHLEAERALADFTHYESAILFSSGYAANIGILSSFLDREDCVFSDTLNHASLIDGCRLSRATIYRYHHCDIENLKHLLSTHRASHKKVAVITESIFSMDGDEAPLREIKELCDIYESALIVDEAHSLGVAGPRGRGLCAYHNVHPDLLVGTLGKAFGLGGAFACASTSIIDFLRHQARSYVFSTAPSPTVVSAIPTSIRLIRDADNRRVALEAHTKKIRSSLHDLDYKILPGESAIIPILVGKPDVAVHLSRSLFERGVLALGIRPPTVPPGTSRLRIVPSATHDTTHIDTVIQIFSELRSAL